MILSLKKELKTMYDKLNEIIKLIKKNDHKIIRIRIIDHPKQIAVDIEMKLQLFSISIHEVSDHSTYTAVLEFHDTKSEEFYNSLLV